jgi:hypothetical protein
MGYALVTSAQTDEKILAPEKIIKLIPDKVKGYYPEGEAQSKAIKLGTLHYSMAEKNFSGSHKRSIKILLFDYKEAPIMYNQATRKFSTFIPIESDSLIMRSVLMSDCKGWESYNVNRKNSQILLGVCNRFFLTVEGTNVDLESLKKVVENFKFEAFPK